MRKSETALMEDFLAKRNPIFSKITKKRALLLAEFDQLVRNYLKSKGARAGRAREYVIDTTLGPLECSPNEGWIACYFVDTERVKNNWRVGAHNTKWNFHFDFDNREQMLAAVGTFKREVDKIL